MITVQSYFKEYQQSFWNWRDQTEVVALSDGSTLVYKAYLLQVLEGLALADTPPLDAVLLALAATKPHGDSSLATVQDSIMRLLYGGVDAKLDHPEGFAFLNVLQQLPAIYHQDKERLFLLQTIFTNSYKTFDKEVVQKILYQYKELTNSAFESLVSDDGTPINPNLLFRTLHLFKLLAQRFPSVEVLLKALEEARLLEAPTLEETMEDVDPSWREKLVEEAATFYMASLVPVLQAGLTLPALQHLQQQDAFGGTADLSNKGTFDRLLISEFAYDKMLFLSRLVNKEALYRQRETAPERPSLTRHLLIDTTVYNWGAIKQMAFGIALSLEHSKEEHLHTLMYIVGQDVQALEWNSVASLKIALGQVQASLNAAEGLRAFFKKKKIKTAQEVVLISSEEAVQQPAMRQVMRQYATRLNYWIAPSANGTVRTYQYYPSKKLLQAFKVSLTDIWHRSKLPKQAEQNLPLESLAGDIPLLIPEPRKYEQLLYSDVDEQSADLFMLAHHGQLLRWHNATMMPGQKVRGWEWIHSGLLEYTLMDIGKLPSNEFVLLAGMRAPKCLDLIFLSSKKQVNLSLPDQEDWHVTNMTYSSGAFYLLDNKGKAWTVLAKDDATFQTYEDNTWVAQLIASHGQAYQALHQRKRSVRHYQVLKNINAVSVTEQGQLLLNGRHQLQLSARDIITIGARNSPTVVSAQQTYKHKRLRSFTFPDGSSILVNSLGLMTLISSNQQVPKIYLPMVLDKPLGLATEQYFCGNPYYYKEHADREHIPSATFFELHIKVFLQTILAHVTV